MFASEWECIYTRKSLIDQCRRRTSLNNETSVTVQQVIQCAQCGSIKWRRILFVFFFCVQQTNNFWFHIFEWIELNKYGEFYSLFLRREEIFLWAVFYGLNLCWLLCEVQNYYLYSVVFALCVCPAVWIGQCAASPDPSKRSYSVYHVWILPIFRVAMHGRDPNALVTMILFICCSFYCALLREAEESSSSWCRRGSCIIFRPYIHPASAII